ncbi:MAG: sugar phosphate isomerase/epimerase [Phycisphaeraceae bacterium]|nr:MAG: sugar phosphate isomerase/epimerase [Phycisphaeraceae bacterium]
MKPAFSTVACPDWTLDEVIPFAARAGYAGVEFRTFGHSASDLTCEPCLTGSAKIRELLADEGVRPAALATSIRFDAPVFPPVLGRVIGDFEKPVRETKLAVIEAAAIECPFVRVFGFELQGESRQAGMRRIVERLGLAAATARHTGVRLLLENGGSFPTAADLVELMDRVGSPLIAAAYSPAVAAMADEDPIDGARLLGSSLASVKLRDMKHTQPAPLGLGDLAVEPFVRALAETGFGGWLVYEYDRLWWRNLADPSEVLIDAAGKMYRWSGRPAGEFEARKYAVA